MKKLLVLLVLLSSCGKQPPPDKIIDNIIYTQDPNTGLCFAFIKTVINEGTWKYSVTYVPCDSIKQFSK